jgi:hypothetical protein
MLSLATVLKVAVLGLPAVAHAAGTLGFALGIHKKDVWLIFMFLIARH